MKSSDAKVRLCFETYDKSLDNALQSALVAVDNGKPLDISITEAVAKLVKIRKISMREEVRLRNWLETEIEANRKNVQPVGIGPDKIEKSATAPLQSRPSEPTRKRNVWIGPSVYGMALVLFGISAWKNQMYQWGLPLLAFVGVGAATSFAFQIYNEYNCYDRGLRGEEKREFDDYRREAATKTIWIMSVAALIIPFILADQMITALILLGGNFLIWTYVWEIRCSD